MPLHEFDDIFCNIKRLLKIKNQGDLAEILGISAQAVSDVKKKNEGIPESWVGIIVEKYNVTRDEIFESDEERIQRLSGTQTITGKNSILAGRSITGGKNTVVLNDSDQLPGDALVLDADELELILLSREVGGKIMLRKFIGELERLKKHIEHQI